MLLVLIITSLAVWFYCLSVLDEEPRASSTAQRITSAVSLTRYALISADSSYRFDLIMALAQREGLVILPKESTDRVEYLPDDRFDQLVLSFVRNSMGESTEIARRVNDLGGLWVSFSIEGDQYWLRVERTLQAPRLGANWIFWFIGMLVLCMVFTMLLTGRIIEPLSRLTIAARTLGRGEYPKPLPVEGLKEIQEVNESFNLMVSGMKRLQSDRELLLAGVSHDLRTPITRLRLEVEMANVSDETREAMCSDLDQMETIVKQFMAYVRQGELPLKVVNLSDTLRHVISSTRIESDPTVHLDVSIDDLVEIRANPTDLERAIQNLIVNAGKYGRSPDGDLHLTIRLRAIKKRNMAELTVSDDGVGIPESEYNRVLRPFERGDTSRGNTSGSGLGLSIVDRVAKAAGGEVRLSQNIPNGLTVMISVPTVLPSLSKSVAKSSST
ncbi:MAG: HAMP domain-containing protein [Burkholderiaceae bacterium]|nr:HAMP domain-containing protein [Burkholderiaceae bacterium]